LKSKEQLWQNVKWEKIKKCATVHMNLVKEKEYVANVCITTEKTDNFPRVIFQMT